MSIYLCFEESPTFGDMELINWKHATEPETDNNIRHRGYLFTFVHIFTQLQFHSELRVEKKRV